VAGLGFWCCCVRRSTARQYSTNRMNSTSYTTTSRTGQDRTGYTHCAAHITPTPTCCSTYSARRHTLGHSPPPPRDKIAPFHPINGVGGGGDGVREEKKCDGGWMGDMGRLSHARHGRRKAEDKCMDGCTLRYYSVWESTSTTSSPCDNVQFGRRIETPWHFHGGNRCMYVCTPPYKIV
jgi:hypothetical protein